MRAKFENCVQAGFLSQNQTVDRAVEISGPPEISGVPILKFSESWHDFGQLGILS